MTYETLTFERDGGVAIITLNRPEAANSLNVPMSRNWSKWRHTAIRIRRSARSS